MNVICLEVASLRFGLHDMDAAHVRRWLATTGRWPPLWVDDTGFVHDGRHRALAALMDGRRRVDAVLVARDTT